MIIIRTAAWITSHELTTFKKKSHKFFQIKYRYFI